MALTVSVDEIVHGSRNPLLGARAHWKRIRLGEVASVLNGFAFKSTQFTKGEGMPLIRIRDVGSDSTDTNYVGDFDARYIVEPGDLLIGMDGDFNCARWRGPRGLLNQRVCKISLHTNEFHPRFLDFALPGYLKAINDATSSVTVKHLSSRTVEEIPLPLPPLHEQEEIVAELEKQFSRLDEAVGNLKRVKANLKRYKAGVLNAAVEGRLVSTEAELARRDGRSFTKGADLLACMRGPGPFGQHRHTRGSDSTHGLRIVDPALLPEGWAPATIGQVAELVTDGDHNPPERVSVGVPHLTAKHVRDWRIETSDCTFISPGDAERTFKRYRPAPGDVIVTCVGTVGRTAVVSPDLQFSADRNLAAIRLAPETVVPRFLQIVLESPQYQQIIRSASGSTAQPHLYLRDLRALTIPVPPHAEQLRIVNEVERLRSLWEALQRQLEAATQRSEQARKAILSRLYAG